MNRKLICILLVLSVLLLAGCGSRASQAAPAPTEVPAVTAAPESAPAPTAAPTPAPTAAPTPEPVSFSDAYLRYLAVFTAVSDEMERRIETHNSLLESRYPDSYYMNSSYLMQVYLPVRPVYPALGSALSDSNVDQVQESLRLTFPDAALSMTESGCYEATYIYKDKTSGEEIPRMGRCVWECDGASGAFRVRAWLDNDMEEFTEFIPLEDDWYLIYTTTDKILVEYADNSVDTLYFAHRISEPAQGDFPGDVRHCSLDDADFYPDGAAEKEWITADADARYILTLEDGETVFSCKVAQDILDARGEKINVLWQDIDPIQLMK